MSSKLQVAPLLSQTTAGRLFSRSFASFRFSATNFHSSKKLFFPGRSKCREGRRRCQRKVWWYPGTSSGLLMVTIASSWRNSLGLLQSRRDKQTPVVPKIKSVFPSSCFPILQRLHSPKRERDTCSRAQRRTASFLLIPSESNSHASFFPNPTHSSPLDLFLTLAGRRGPGLLFLFFFFFTLALLSFCCSRTNTNLRAKNC